MKKTVLLLLLFAFGISHGQDPATPSPIISLSGYLPVNTGTADGYDYRGYQTYGNVSSFVQTTSGVNQAWNISGLTGSTNFMYYLNSIPSANELMLYPGTYMVTRGSKNGSTTADNKTYTSNGVTLTGYSDTELTLNYSTNSIDLGTFPKNYGSSFSDVVAGTYVFGAYSGTFTGTFVTSVDAYGTMTFEASEVFNVTRLKTVETLQIIYPGLGNVGSFVQTTYRYYREGDLWPYVKSTNRVIVIAALNINSNVTQIEKAPAAFLSVPSVVIEESLSLFPNPATNTINVTSSQDIVSLTVVDQLGKVVLTKNKSSNIDVSGLQSGIYFIKIATDAGSSVKKFIKN